MDAEPLTDRSPMADALVSLVGRVLLGLACAVIVPYVPFAVVLVAAAITARPGVGDVDLAKARIHRGMTKGEVRSVLGLPHREGEYGHSSEWDYWEHAFVGSVLRIEFGPDDRVTSRYTWCQ